MSSMTTSTEINSIPVSKRHTIKKSAHKTIKLVVKENPKRPGSRARKKFDVLMKMNGKSLKELKAQEGRYPSLDSEEGWPATELRWALRLGLIKLS